MAVFEGKTSTERNKIIAAAVLGVVALIALYMAFGRTLFGGTTATTTKSSPTPRPAASPGAPRNDPALPTASEQDFVYQTTPVVYNPGGAFAPDSGRNIFAFYEPPPPTPYVPTPVPQVSIKPPSPTPTPAILVQYITPPNVYAGSQGFRLEIAGDRFTPDARIYFNQAEMPTTFINPQKVVADIPANLIAQEGPRQIIVQTPDGTAYSTQIMLNVMAPPRPQFLYTGALLRTRGNNNTAVFERQGKPGNFSARLNDVIDNRFRLVNISAAEVIFEDVNLGFRHRVPISKATTTSGQTNRPGQDNPTFDPNQMNIPGIPNNIPRYIPPQPNKTPDKKTDEDVDDDGDGNNR